MKIVFTKEEFMKYCKDIIPAIYRADCYEIVDISTVGYPLEGYQITLEKEVKSEKL